jgi:Tol biopolymer transport system component
MSLPPGTRLGPYEIVAPVGAGGMGEVYRAHDSRLGRDVAIKMCRLGGEAAAEDRVSLVREARAVASLSHPHICAVFDVGSHDDVDYYVVMELLDGQTLASRLARGALPLREALQVARQILQALAAAHAAGIVHRDLKPQNVMLTGHGVKLLDFGLARPIPRLGGGNAETALTRSGIVAGTVPYMAPEQIEGRAVDARADLFAFGATFFEMLTGRRAFPGDSTASVISAVLRDEPPPVSSVSNLPPSLDRLIAACLAKSPDARWHCAEDLRQALDWISAEPSIPAVPPAATSPSRRWLRAAALVAGAAGLFAAGRSSLGTPAGTPTDRPVHLTIPPPRGTSLLVPDGPPGTVQLALSPDGSTLVFVATSPEGGQVLYRRRFDASGAERIAGTEGALFPAWSPDNRTLLFFTATEVKTVDDSGEPPRVLGRLVQPYGGTWIDNERLLVASAGELFRLSTADGRMEKVAAPLAPSKAFVAPLVVPGQPWFIVAEVNVDKPMDAATMTARAADGTQLATMLSAHSRPIPAGPQTLVYVKSGDVFAQEFDPATGAMRGEPRQVVTDVGGAAPTSWASLAASARGDIAYAARARQLFPLRWWSRTGQVLATVAEDVTTPSLSPDERFIAMRRPVSGGAPGTTDLFLVDAARGASQRVTFDTPPDSSPVWAPGSDRIAYSSMREGLDDLWVKDTSPGAGLLVARGPAIPSDWSRDGRLIAFHSTRTAAGRWGWQFDLGVVSAQAPHEVTHLTSTPFQEVQARFSPDGHHMAYASNESGAFEVYLQPYPPDGRRTVLSIGGGADPMWRQDGKELFYYAADGYVMRVPIAWAPSPVPAKPERLFRLQLPPLSLPYRSRLSVSGDGQRFLALEEPDADPISIHVILNWLTPSGRP